MNTVCTACMATNRLPEERIDDGAKCGRCGHSLFDGEVINATAETLDKLLQDDLAIVIDFWAPWCGPCRSFAPIFEAVAAERAGKVRFVKVNTEAEPALSTRFRIRSIPTIMLYRNGKMVDMLNGAVPKVPFDNWLDEQLAAEPVAR
ncbi:MULTISPECIES: thioredoxin TrxC [Yersinia]|uniref:Thioredoxin n=2 Tax=Yersinia bercovieri TaxID=634 RepID=A0A2G4U2I4_YERBE|nr:MULTISPECIES: thioredoxin TrxC [Yersinia]MCB5303555.1 thioredoxin TrxC [Yersinia bercovieri]MDN0104238.1 thioredoxin TrxC [Yersinia bercovieri]PHZ27523.1 thioredoxin TrxC [Yersinia bercovieri]QDW34528.1 thioredoxin TrxC [Yersinia sp. KBS0713]QKJ07333.1 thioredoxin TrxC [Yersinia bercovieri ATCC 43970]